MLSRLLIPLCIAGLALAQDSTRPQLTARELFYAAVKTPAAAPATATTTAQAEKPKPQRAQHRKAPPPQLAHANPQPAPAAPVVAAPAATPEPAPAAPVTTSGGAAIIQASVRSTAPAPTAGPALGLKYTILKRSGDNMVEVAPDTVFHAGDRIQFSVQTNVPGYLYIISQGSSGTWKPMFPSPEIDDGNNHIDGFHAYTMPPKSRMVFDEQTGIEKIFIVFSRAPEPDLEQMIYSLQGTKPKPAASPEAPPPPRQMVEMASLNIDDATVGRLRNTYSRDLIIEKVDESTPGDQKEKAVYVVNPTGSSDSRVVADIRLVHQ